MSALEIVGALCDQSAKQLREALLKYRKANTAVPYAVEADPRLYGDLLRHYLQWTAGILAAMEKAAAARPLARASVDHLIDRSAAYFKDDSRWPRVRSLDHPAWMLIPAYYSVRAAQQVNSLFVPPLLTLDLIEAHLFAIELLGKPASDRICEQKNADLKSLTRAQEDQPPEKPLRYRSFLHMSNRDSLKTARAAKPNPPAPVAPPRPAVPRPAAAAVDEAQRLMWDKELASTSIVLGRCNSPPDYGSSYTSTETFLHLLGNHRFRKEVLGSMRVSYVGSMSQTSIHRETRGTWEVRSTGTRIYLVLTDDSGDTESLWLEKGTRGILRVDGRDRPWRSR